MNDSKICSLRLQSNSLEWADIMARKTICFSRSDVLRLAIWIGAKVITSKCLNKLISLEGSEEFSNFEVPLEDVLRTAGFSLENLKKVE